MVNNLRSCVKDLNVHSFLNFIRSDFFKFKEVDEKNEKNLIITCTTVFEIRKLVINDQ